MSTLSSLPLRGKLKVTQTQLEAAKDKASAIVAKARRLRQQLAAQPALAMTGATG